MLNSAAGNGNVLLSWGALWNGQFESSQKDTLLKVGQWLKKYGYTYYSTKGGPWMPNNQLGSTYKENKIYLYVYNWRSGTLALPALPGNPILKATFINLNEKLSWKQTTDSLSFTPPFKADSIVTVIELTMKQPVKAVLRTTDKSLFNDPAYGARIKSITIKPEHWKNNQRIIDLNKSENITGLGLYPNNGKISLSVSLDGKQWKDLKLVDQEKEISISTFIAGAHVLGQQVRYIRLKASGLLKDLRVDVYAK